MKYKLDNSSKKFICPNCNKRRFVRYVEVETNQYLDESLGRCDRESSCGYFKKPERGNAFFKKNDFQKENINSVSFHNSNLVEQSLKHYKKNNFYNYLTSVFSSEKIDEVFFKYKVGTSKAWNGATVFWQIDENNKIRGGKIILFNKDTCNRIKEPYSHVNWAHNKLNLKNFVLKQCLFGLHLNTSSKTIALVESEKTAIIMSLFLPEYVWMSTGGKQNFNKELLLPLKLREIIAFPDKSEFNDWQKKANDLNKIGFKIKVSDYVEKLDFESGTDLADIYLEINQRSSTIEKLTKDEQEVLNLSRTNPNLLLLIETFDLLDTSDNPFDIKKMKNLLI